MRLNIRLFCLAAAAFCAAAASGAPEPRTEEVLMAQARRDAERTARQADRAYAAGVRALDSRQWEKAIEAFEQAAKEKDRADGALYWKAYALNKLGRRDQALNAIAELQKGFPNSRWAGDAKALAVEVRQASGQPVRPEAAQDDDLKLIAINSLMTTDPERAVPLLEGFLQGPNPPKYKERALFVLAQTGTPRARQVLADVARGKANPDLQAKAIEYLGLFGGQESRQTLADVYKSSNDARVKRSILRGFMVSGDRERLLEVAKQEQSADLRREAIRQLGVMGADDALWQMYQAESSLDVKREILRALFIGGKQERLAEVARSAAEPELKREAIRSLGLMGKRNSQTLASLYTGSSDQTVRKAVIEAMFLSGDAAGLVALARKETNPELKREAVHRLSLMGRSKEAADFMEELLKQ